MQIGGTLTQGLTALLSPEWRPQIVPISEILDAVFERRLHFGVPAGISGRIEIKVGYMDCWRPFCGKQTQIITQIIVIFGPNACSFSLPQLGEYPDLVDIVLAHLPTDIGLGFIKRRYSRTQNRSYLSNSCVHCGGFIGEHFEINARYNEKAVRQFSIQISERWKSAIAAHDSHWPGWNVYTTKPNT